jgi:hypothetical protein
VIVSVKRNRVISDSAVQEDTPITRKPSGATMGP